MLAYMIEFPGMNVIKTKLLNNPILKMIIETNKCPHSSKMTIIARSYEFSTSIISDDTCFFHLRAKTRPLN